MSGDQKTGEIRTDFATPGASHCHGGPALARHRCRQPSPSRKPGGFRVAWDPWIWAGSVDKASACRTGNRDCTMHDFFFLHSNRSFTPGASSLARMRARTGASRVLAMTWGTASEDSVWTMPRVKPFCNGVQFSSSRVDTSLCIQIAIAPLCNREVASLDLGRFAFPPL